jgi:hypothetical protein
MVNPSRAKLLCSKDMVAITQASWVVLSLGA